VVELCILHGHFIQSFRGVHSRSYLKPHTSAGYAYVLRLSSCLFDKSATDFHIKNKRLRAKPAVTLRPDPISQYSAAAFK
jgi:hypothetical protein